MSDLSIMPSDPTVALQGLGGLGALGPSAPGPLKDDRPSRQVEQAVNDFESILLTRLLEEMRTTIDDGGLLGETADQQVQDLFWMCLAQDLSAKGGLGICRDLYRQLARTDPTAAPAGELEALR